MGRKSWMPATMVASALFGRGSASSLAVGDRAPAFELSGSDGTTHRLGDYIGREAVVLAWFPKAFTRRLNVSNSRSLRDSEPQPFESVRRRVLHGQSRYPSEKNTRPSRSP